MIRAAFLCSFCAATLWLTPHSSRCQVTLPDSIIKAIGADDTLAAVKAHIKAFKLKKKGGDSTHTIHLQTGLQLARAISAYEQMYSIYNQMGISAFGLSDLPLTLLYMDSSLQVATADGHKDNMAMSWGNLGAVYYTSSNYSKSLEFYLKSLRYEELNDGGNRINSYINIGMLYRELKSDTLARYYLEKGMALATEKKDTNMIVKALNNLAIMAKNQGDIASAIDQYLRGVTLAEKANLSGDLADLYNNLGGVYANNGLLNKAEEYYMKSLKLTRETGREYGLSACYQSLGNIGLKRKNYEEAEKYFLLGEENAKKFDDYRALSIGSKCL